MSSKTSEHRNTRTPRPLHRPLGARGTARSASLLALSTAALCGLAGGTQQAPAASLWWDTTNAAGANAGTGNWDAAGGTNWATLASPAVNVNPGPWQPGADAIFSTGGVNTVNVIGNVQVNSISQINNGTLTTIGGGVLQIGAGGVSVTGNQNLTLDSDITLTDHQAWSPNNLRTIVVNGVIGGAFDLAKINAGNLTLTNANTYSGATTITNGGMILSGNGSIADSSSVTVSTEGVPTTISAKLTLDNTGTNNADRLNDSGTVTIGRTGEFIFLGNATANTTETVGTLAFNTGNAIVTITQPAAGVVTTLDAGSLSRSNYATALIRGETLGESSTQGARLSLDAQPTGAHFVGAGDAATGVGAVKNLAIVPWLMGDTSASGSGANFVTYDTQTGSLRTLGPNEQDAMTAGSSGYADTGNNVSATAVNLTYNAGARTFNSLRVGDGAELNGGGGAGDTLTLDSGALAQTGTSGTVGGFSQITFGNDEAVVSAAGTLTVNSPIDVTNGGGLTKAGGGTVALGASNAYSGQTVINQGTLQVGTGGTTGDLGATPSVALNGGTLAFSRSDDFTFAGNITGVATRLFLTSANRAGSVIQLGAGTTTLSGTNDLPGGIVVEAGTLNITGSTTTGATGFPSNVVGWSGNTAESSRAATLSVSGAGSLNTSGSSLILAPDPYDRGLLRVSGTASLTAGGGVTVGRNTDANAAAYQTGGTVDLVSNTLMVGWGGGNGFYSLSGGTLNGGLRIATNTGTAATGLPTTGSISAFYQSGGTITSNGGLQVGVGQNDDAPTIGVVYQTAGTHNSTNMSLAGAPNSRAEFTLAGGSVTLSQGFTVGGNSNTTAVLNLNGGTLKTGQVLTHGGDSTRGARHLNFNAGTIKPQNVLGLGSWINASPYLTVNVFAGGATVDTDGLDAAIIEPLLAPAGSGVTSATGMTVPITDGGSGYLGAPVVTISGATGATAVANMVDDESGNGTFKVASITITNPGINASSPSFTFSGGGATSAAVPVSLSAVANANTGGLTKVGAGTLSLAGPSTYGGATRIEAGTLKLITNSVAATAGSIENSSGVHVLAGATFDISGVPVGATVNGLSGAGTVVGGFDHVLTVADGGLLSPGDSAGTLTFTSGRLTLGEGAEYDFEVDGTTQAPVSDRVNLTGQASTVNFAGSWTLNLLNLGTVDPTDKTFVLFDSLAAISGVGTWTLDYGTTGWSGGLIEINPSDSSQVILSGLTAPVPEPGSIGLLLLGAAGLMRRRRKHA